MFDSARKKLPDADYVSIVKSLYAERVVISVGAAVTAAAAASTFLHTNAAILGWVTGAFIVIGVVRHMLGVAFDRAMKQGLDADQASKWERRLTIATCLLALLYGMWSFISLVFVADPFAALASTMVSMAVLIGLTTRNFAADRIVTVSSLLVALPVGAGFLLKGEIYYAVIGVLLMPFLFSLRKLAADVRKIFLDAVHGRLEANRLASELDSALATMVHGLCMIDDDGHVLVINDQARQLLQIEADEDVVGRSVAELVQLAMMRRVVTKATAQMLIAEFSVNQNAKLVIELASGRHCEVTSSTRFNHTVLMFEDITERVLADAKITAMARYDSLTQLPNRYFFSEQTKARLSEFAAWGQPAPISLAMIDIDDFKHVNDTFGHPIGDLLIRLVADRLSGLFGDQALVSRFGGDEFVVFRSAGATHAMAEEDAAAITAALRVPFNLGANECTVTASIGITLADGGKTDLDDILTRADLALYHAKAHGKACWSVFHDQMDVDYRKRQQLKAQLHGAIEKNQLFVVYQPIIDIRTRLLVGCEALVRWRHPEFGIISPALFIPLAEQTGTITDLTRFVLATATRECLNWPDHMTVSVNLSANDFRSVSIERMVAETLETAGLPADRLVVEITETALIEEPEKASQVLAALRSIGVEAALDDFGTGYSSLGYLTTMSFSRLKIDQSFTRDIATGTRARKLIESLARLAHDLDMIVTIEGVETEEQLEVIINTTGIEYAQGFLFGPPLPAKDIAELIARLSGTGSKSGWQLVEPKRAGV